MWGGNPEWQRLWKQGKGHRVKAPLKIEYSRPDGYATAAPIERRIRNELAIYLEQRDPGFDDIRSALACWASQRKVLERPAFVPELPHQIFHRRFHPASPLHIVLGSRRHPTTVARQAMASFFQVALSSPTTVIRSRPIAAPTRRSRSAVLASGWSRKTGRKSCWSPPIIRPLGLVRPYFPARLVVANEQHDLLPRWPIMTCVMPTPDCARISPNRDRCRSAKRNGKRLKKGCMKNVAEAVVDVQSGSTIPGRKQSEADSHCAVVARSLSYFRRCPGSRNTKSTLAILGVS